MLLRAQTAISQELTPRAYVITPVGLNAISVGYTHLGGGVQFDGAIPITDVKADVNLFALGYYRSLDFLGRSANIAVGTPYGLGDLTGTAADVPKHAHRSGLLDSFLRLSVNLIGAPAMQPAEFAQWHQDVLLGVSLKIVPPTGQYNPSTPINWGTNRWAFKPEIGYSQRWGNWLVDGYAGAWFFTSNPDFFPGTNSRAESPVGAIETHLSYDFGPRMWVSFDVNFWWGGETSLNGIPNHLTYQKNSRVGLTASLPLTKSQSIKISYSDGAYVGYGGNYRNVSLVWTYGWFGWPRLR